MGVKRNRGRIRGTNSGSVVAKVGQLVTMLTRMGQTQVSLTQSKTVIKATIGHSMKEIGDKTSGIKTVTKIKATTRLTKTSRIHHIMVKGKITSSKISVIGGSRKGLNTSSPLNIHSMKATNSSMVKRRKGLILVIVDPEGTHTTSSSINMDDLGNNTMETMTGTTNPSKISSLSTGSSSSSLIMVIHNLVKMLRKTCPTSIRPLSITLQPINTRARVRLNLRKASRIHPNSTSHQSQAHSYLQHQLMFLNLSIRACLKLSLNHSIQHKSLLNSRTLSKTTMRQRIITHSRISIHKSPRIHRLTWTPNSRLLLHSKVTPKPTTTLMLKTCSSKYHNKLNSKRMHNLSLLLMCRISLASTKTFEKKNNFLFAGGWLVHILD